MPLIDEKEITYEDVILETIPFAEELVDWCRIHSEFQNALKITHPERFVHLGTVIITKPRMYPNDEVIGVYAYDYQLAKPLFKQDFIINIDKEYKHFRLFTRNPTGISKWVKDITEFYLTYGKEGDYVNSHYISFAQLPDKAKPFGIKAKKLGDNLKINGFTKPSRKIIYKMYTNVMREKKRLGLLSKHYIGI